VNYTLLFLSILPSVVLMWMFLTSDKYPEPPGALTVAFLLGMLVPVVFHVLSPLFDFAQSLFPADNPYLSGALDAFLLAAVPEECLKFAVLYGLCRRFPAFDEPMDGIVYGVTVAVGFATFENLAYVMSGDSYMLAVSRGVLAVPNHAMDGAIMGYFVGRAAFTDGGGRGFLAKALLIPMLLHGLYDTPVMIHAHAEAMGVRLAASASAALNVLFFTVVLRQIVYVARITGKMRREQEPGPLPQPEAAPGGISALAGEVAQDMIQSDVVLVIRNTRTGMDMLLVVLCVLGLFLSLGVPLSGAAGVLDGLSTALSLLFLGGSILFGFRSMVGLIKNLSPLRLRRLREREPGGR
jgi:RsiW-degrading membrane proteinase PrsW (M82 family)